ncbi:PilZ domain-containing protein [Mariprofundus ferrinatatus]|uniref:PilZ domain-containing protein n=1 Tax=Mariprofundus ferrinatatus TaxID=1921087 RepID=A0A2K8L608_9PROT|nr:PilZ domain-containing protein [Mariprofundus ferrinatatus]ATX82532.1 PilZ domain-containing protein [Mariprofundus ferrinatatus]
MFEKRKEKRLIVRDLTKGELYHPGTGQYFTVEKVRDVSSKGVGLNVNGYLRQGEQVRIGFKHGRTHLQMYGHVAWCSQAMDDLSDGDVKSSSFMMGISL